MLVAGAFGHLGSAGDLCGWIAWTQTVVAGFVFVSMGSPSVLPRHWHSHGMVTAPDSLRKHIQGLCITCCHDANARQDQDGSSDMSVFL